LTFDPRRLLPWLTIAANVAAAVMFMQAIITGLFPYSHHWILPGMALVLLAQSAGFRDRGPVWPLTALSVLLVGIGAARLRTIWESHHLVHLALALGLCAVHHERLSRWQAPPAWSEANRRWAGSLGGVALLAAAFAWRQGIWWGLAAGS